MKEIRKSGKRRGGKAGVEQGNEGERRRKKAVKGVKMRQKRGRRRG